MDPVLSAELVRAWDALAIEVGALPTAGPLWWLACLAAFPGRPGLHTHSRDGVLTAIAPLVQRSGVLELAGGPELGEPSDFLARSPQDLSALTDRIAAARSPLLLERIPADSATIAALRDSYGSRARIRVSGMPESPRIDLDSGWAEPGGGLSSSRRSALRRSRRRAEKLGEVTVESTAPGPGEVTEALDRAFAVESRSWKGIEGTAVCSQPPIESFFHTYAAEMATRGALRVEFLRIGGRAVAMQVGARWNDRHWLFKIGYDAAYASVSPGQLLLAESIAAAARDGLTAYELLGSRAQWTDAWTKDQRPSVRVVVLPAVGRSAAALGTLGKRAAEKRLRRTARRGKQRIDAAARSHYMAGPELDDALREERRYAQEGYPTVVGFWNGPEDSPDAVGAAAIESAAALPPGSEVAIKLTGIGGDRPLLDELLDACTERDLTLHLDAMGPDSASAALATARRLDALAPGRVGCTLPGRWARSAADADALRESGMRVRIVKGEIAADPAAEVDPRTGFLDLVDRLAGGSCQVEIATQDAPLAELALTTLAAAGTSCEQQVLHAMRGGAAIAVARRLGVPVRVYVPYGTGRLPYRREDLARNPWLALTLTRDVLSGLSSGARVPLAFRPPGRPA